ncbi:MAG: Dabb family protein [Verrucomicrobiales bacterium]|nr:Dabb family protein [Verrucomicrobiales bacterium]
MTVLLASALVAPAASAADAPKKGRGKLVHMVAFKFKDSASQEDIRKVEDAFAALPSKIPQIASFEAGTNVSPEKLDKGFTHGFLLTFHTQTDRDEYLVHPDHKAFGTIIGPYIADVFVIDFWGKKAPKAESADGNKKAKKAAKKDK